MKEKLIQQGCVIEQRNLDFLEYVVPTYYIIAFAEASSNLGRFDGVRYGVRTSKDESLNSMYNGTRADGFGPEVKRTRNELNNGIFLSKADIELNFRTIEIS